MSQIERRRRGEVDPYAPPPATSWREAREESSAHFRAAIRIHNGGQLNRLIAQRAKEALAETEELGPLGDIIAQSYVYRAVELRDRYMG
jgi:hypothetical protein